MSSLQENFDASQAFFDNGLATIMQACCASRCTRALTPCGRIARNVCPLLAWPELQKLFQTMDRTECLVAKRTEARASLINQAISAGGNQTLTSGN